jgi:hypothetical protein
MSKNIGLVLLGTACAGIVVAGLYSFHNKNQSSWDEVDILGDEEVYIGGKKTTKRATKKTKKRKTKTKKTQ